MPILDVSKAVQYGLFAEFLTSQFEYSQTGPNSYLPQFNKASYSSGYITLSQWLASNYNNGSTPIPADVTRNTAINALNMYNYNSGITFSGPIGTSPPVYLTKPDISQIAATPIGNATADLSHSTLVSSNKIVATTGLTQKFGDVVASQILSYSSGTTISETITSGVQDTTSDSHTATASLKVEGSVPFISKVEVSTSVASTWGSQKQVSFSDAKQNSATATQTLSITTNIGSISANPKNPDGSYGYTYENGQTFNLIPGHSYKTLIQITQDTISTPVIGKFEISGPSMTLSAATKTNPNSILKTTEDVTNALQYAMNYGYQKISDIDPSSITYQSNPNLAIFTGLINGTSTTAYDATVIVQPVASISDLSVKNFSSNSLMKSSSSTLGIETEPLLNATTINLQTYAANNLASQTGVYFDTSSTENLITTSTVKIIGSEADTVNVGNLDYTFTKFNNAAITAGDGNNIITIAETESNNFYSLGNGNNTVQLGGNGNGNDIFLGNGTSYVIAGSLGKNFIVNGSGVVVLNITKASGFTQVSEWDFSKDSIIFDSNINLADVSLKFDAATLSYDIYVSGKLVANLISNGNYDPYSSTGAVDTSYYAPIQRFIQPGGLVANLYADAFNRVPDTLGQNYWTNALTKGLSVDQFITNIFSSPEFVALNSTNNQLITALYHDILGRAPEAAGLAYWIGQLNNNVSIANVVQAFIQGDEFFNLEVGITGSSSTPTA